MTLTQQLLTLARAYCAARGISAARLSTLLFNDGKKLGSLEAGGDLATRIFERAMRWLAANWPEDADWPQDVPRPTAKAPLAHVAPVAAGSGAGASA